MRHDSVPKLLFLACLLGSLAWADGGFSAFATKAPQGARAKIQSASVIEEMEDLQKEVSDREAEAKDLQKQISSYKTRLQKLQSEKISLQNELEILSNRMEETRLTLQSTQGERDRVTMEIKKIGRAS